MYTEQDKNYNEIRGNYTRAVYDFFGANSLRSPGAVRQVGGLINGDGPNGIYSNMWGNVGAQQASYGKSMSEAFNMYVQSEFSIAPKSNPKAKHEIQIGMNAEKELEEVIL